jgi:hypothetical protein
MLVRAKKTIQARGDACYDFEDFIELDHADAFSVCSEDWEELCSDDDAEPGHERTYSSVLRGELKEDATLRRPEPAPRVRG